MKICLCANNVVTRLLFTSRIVLILILCIVKASTIALIRTVFTTNFKLILLWFKSIVVTTICDSLFGSILIWAGCLLEVQYYIHDSTCPHNVSPFASDHNFSHKLL